MTAVAEYTGMMAELSERGDTKILWNKDNPDEVAAARKTFDDLVTNKRFAAFRVEGKKGKQGERMTKFDPEAERIILVPPMRGG